jgi:hypothetical protein
MTENEDNIKNKTIDIVDNSVLGKASVVADDIKSVLDAKRQEEIDNYKQDFAKTMFNNPAHSDVESEE